MDLQRMVRITENAELLSKNEEESTSLFATQKHLNGRKSHIQRLYSPELLKKLFAHALMIDIDSNNEKVDIIKELVGDEFAELGPGTNRYGMLAPDGYCHKIALDRRGIVDNITEFRRSPELEWVAPKAYECNGIILAAENVELMTPEDFRANREQILEICDALSKVYIFTDIGYAMKNFCNWGIRINHDLVILDTGYLIPRLGNEEAMTCPVCGADLQYNKTFTSFVCSKCNTNFSFVDVYRRMNNKLEKELYEDLLGFDLPDFSSFNATFYNSMMKGGHIDHASIPTGEPVDDESDILRYEDIRDILRAQEELKDESSHRGEDDDGASNPIQ